MQKIEKYKNLQPHCLTTKKICVVFQSTSTQTKDSLKSSAMFLEKGMFAEVSDNIFKGQLNASGLDVLPVCFPQDKANKRRMLMGIDKRKKKLKFLRRTRFEAFEHVCKELGITYTFPPEYYRRATKRWQAKKALCIKVGIHL